MASVPKKKVVVVDDHPIVRKGVRALLSQEPDIVVCGDAESLGEALAVIEKTKPDIVIIDIGLRGSDGLELIKSIRYSDRTLPVLVMSMYDEALYAERVLRAGGNGYIMKEAVDTNIVAAVRLILAGDVYVGEAVRLRLLRSLAGGGKGSVAPVDRLSDRELEVYRLIGGGKGTREIAAQLSLSVKTIETYRAHIKEKLGLETASELSQAAVQWVSAQQT